MAIDLKKMVEEVETMQKENEALKKSNQELTTKIEGMNKIMLKIKELSEITLKPTTQGK